MPGLCEREGRTILVSTPLSADRARAGDNRLSVDEKFGLHITCLAVAN